MPRPIATRVIQGLAISQQLAKLAEGIDLVDKELHSQVWQPGLLMLYSF